jgi:hypothetical protein
VRRLSPDDPIHYLALTQPDMSAFSGEEMRMIGDAIDLVCHKHTSRSISQKTHDIIWKLAEIDEEIPYEALWATRFDPITNEDLARAKKALATHV